MSSKQSDFWECIGIGAAVLGGAGLLVGAAAGAATAAITSAATVAGGALIGGIAGGVVGATCGGIATCVAINLLAEEWKYKYFDQIIDWIHKNSEEGSMTQKFYMKCHDVVSGAMQYTLQCKKKKMVKADIVAKNDDNTETTVTTVKLPIEKVVGSGASQQPVLIGSKKEFLDIEKQGVLKRMLDMLN